MTFQNSMILKMWEQSMDNNTEQFLTSSLDELRRYKPMLTPKQQEKIWRNIILRAAQMMKAGQEQEKNC